jgi:hypothetical protein
MPRVLVAGSYSAPTHPLDGMHLDGLCDTWESYTMLNLRGEQVQTLAAVLSRISSLRSGGAGPDSGVG